jgi:lipid-binding SYLF domain-containing protein
VRGIRSSLGYDVAVDLGTATTRLYAYGRGLVLSEPTVLAYSLHTGALEAAGEAAKLQIGRESRSRRVSHPLRYGVVSDSDVDGRLLDSFLNRALPRRSFWKPHLLMVAPSVTTELERRALEDAGYCAGAGRVTLITASQAIAAGAPLAEGWRTAMVVDIGKGVVTCRDPQTREWGAPTFLKIGGGSFGAQIGVQSTDIILVGVNRSSIDAFTKDRLELGGEAEVAAGPVGRRAGASTDAPTFSSQFLSYSRNKGLFAGVSLQGAVIDKHGDLNRAVYGPDATAAGVMKSAKTAPAAVAIFPQTVAKYAGAAKK